MINERRKVDFIIASEVSFIKTIEIKVFEPGDIVLYQTGENGLKSNIGMILKRKENGNYAVLSIYDSVYKDIQPSWVSSINNVEKAREDIFNYYEEQIVELQKQIRKPTQEEKDTEKKDKYNVLKGQIIATAKNLLNAEDDDDFENKLKSICNMKKRMFEIPLECGSEIRKENGAIKYQIKVLIENRDSYLRNISDKNINMAFNY